MLGTTFHPAKDPAFTGIHNIRPCGYGVVDGHLTQLEQCSGWNSTLNLRYYLDFGVGLALCC